MDIRTNTVQTGNSEMDTLALLNRAFAEFVVASDLNKTKFVPHRSGKAGTSLDFKARKNERSSYSNAQN